MKEKSFSEYEPTSKTNAEYSITGHLFSGKSSFQKVDVVQSDYFGKMLFNDGLVMITEKDEFVYHEMMAHVSLFTHPNPKRVLVIGGGDGGTAREVLRHSEVEHCDMVEIDALVVEACQKFIPQTAVGMKEDSRFSLHIDDGVKFVKETKNKYDVILVDSTDPIGPSQPLFGPDFYCDVKNCLNENGLVMSQAESPFLNPKMQKKLASILKSEFPLVRFMNYSNMTYPGGCWSFSYASLGPDPVEANLERAKKSALPMQYYNTNLHRAAFVLPQFQRENLEL